MQLLEQVTSSLGSKKYDKSDLALIIRLNASLKTHGQHMEMFHRELLDKAQVIISSNIEKTRQTVPGLHSAVVHTYFGVSKG